MYELKKQVEKRVFWWAFFSCFAAIYIIILCLSYNVQKSKFSEKSRNKYVVLIIFKGVLYHANVYTVTIFSSPGPKVQVNYCHHLASVVCKLFTFQASSPKPLGRLEPNLAGMFLGWSSTKLLFFVPVGYSIWLPRPIICSDWLKFQRSSSLKLMN